MSKSNIVEKIESVTLPVAMLLGVVLSPLLISGVWLVPYLLALMLFLTFSSVKPSDLNFAKWHIWLILIQVFGSILIFFLLKGANRVVAQGALISVLAPTATASVVIGQLLGAKIESMITYSLLCNTVVAIVAPILLPLVGAMPDIPFWQSSFMILMKVIPIIVLPILLAFAVRAISTRAIERVSAIKGTSLYVWGVMLMITIGQVTEAIKEMERGELSTLLYLGAVALVISLILFGVGRWIGKRYGEPVAVAQSLGQKNTILAIWMAQTYLNPVSSFAPATYIIWQNIINSLQVWHRKRGGQEAEQ